tara:strand:+ start:163 stop:753 length:591 start_codon:yes stop_codon:yes gene_type:complete
LLEYLAKLKRQAEWRQVKLMVLGQEAVGKTSLISALLSVSEKKGGNLATQGIDINSLKMDRNVYSVWDFGGQEVRVKIFERGLVSKGSRREDMIVNFHKYMNTQISPSNLILILSTGLLPYPSILSDESIHLYRLLCTGQRRLYRKAGLLVEEDQNTHNGWLSSDLSWDEARQGRYREGEGGIRERFTKVQPASNL